MVGFENHITLSLEYQVARVWKKPTLEKQMTTVEIDIFFTRRCLIPTPNSAMGAHAPKLSINYTSPVIGWFLKRLRLSPYSDEKLLFFV